MGNLSKSDLDKWRKESLRVAREMEIFSEDILGNLEEIDINLKEKDKDDLWYGFTNYDSKSIDIYSQNSSDYLIGFSDIANQSGMDHELIGHMGNYLAGRNHGERDACVTQHKMAKYRSKKSFKWKIISKTIPLIQKYHRDVDFDSY